MDATHTAARPRRRRRRPLATTAFALLALAAGGGPSSLAAAAAGLRGPRHQLEVEPRAQTQVLKGRGERWAPQHGNQMPRPRQSAMLPDISHGRRRLLIGEADRMEEVGHGRTLGGGREKGRDGRGGGNRQRGGAKTRGRGNNKKSGRGNNNKRSKPDRSKPDRNKPDRGGGKDNDRGKRDKIKAENAKRHERNEKMKEMREKMKKGGRGKDRSKKQGRKPKQKSGGGRGKPKKSGRGKNKFKKQDKDKDKDDSSKDRPKKNDKDQGKKNKGSSKDRPDKGKKDKGKKDKDSSRDQPDKGKKDKDDSSKDRPQMNVGGNKPNDKPGRDEPMPSKKPGKQGSKNEEGKKPGKNQTDGKFSFGGNDKKPGKQDSKNDNGKKPGKQGSKNDNGKKPGENQTDGKLSLGGNGKKPKSSSDDGPLPMDADAGTTWQFGGPLGFNFVSSLEDASTLVEDFEGSISLKWDAGSWTESNDSYRGSRSTASGIADATLGSSPAYSKRSLTTESGFHRGVLTFMLKADSLRLPNEAFYVEVDGTVALPPSVAASTPSREWVEYSVPVGSGVHSVAFVHVHNPFGLESLPGDGAGGLWMDELRYAPFTTELSEVEMTNDGWNLDGNSKAVASTAEISGNAGSADISFVLYTSHGGELSYNILSETTGPHDDFAVDLNGMPAEAVFGEMVSFDKRRLTIPPGKQTVTLRHRKNPGRLGQGVLDGLSPVGTEGRTKLQKIEFWGQAPAG